MREQVSSSRSFDPDKPEIRTKLSSMKKSGISDPRLCLCEYRPCNLNSASWSKDFIGFFKHVPPQPHIRNCNWAFATLSWGLWRIRYTTQPELWGKSTFRIVLRNGASSYFRNLITPRIWLRVAKVQKSNFEGPQLDIWQFFFVCTSAGDWYVHNIADQNCICPPLNITTV
jgi:hypothetical protein